MNQLQKALVNAGLAEESKVRKYRGGKQFKCKKCDTIMIRPDNTNLMYCPKCDKSFYLFDK